MADNTNNENNDNNIENKMSFVDYIQENILNSSEENNIIDKETLINSIKDYDQENIQNKINEIFQDKTSLSVKEIKEILNNENQQQEQNNNENNNNFENNNKENKIEKESNSKFETNYLLNYKIDMNNKPEKIPDDLQFLSQDLPDKKNKIFFSKNYEDNNNNIEINIQKENINENENDINNLDKQKILLNKVSLVQPQNQFNESLLKNINENNNNNNNNKNLKNLLNRNNKITTDFNTILNFNKNLLNFKPN